LAGSVRQAFQALDPILPPVEIDSVQRRLTEQDRPRRFQMELMGMFGGVSLLIAATGLYGMIAYWVESRKREIGVRMALGATRVSVGLLVLKHSFAVAGIGLVIGAIGSKLLGRAISGYLFGVAPTDPVTFLCATGSLGGIVLIASIIPAMRAAQTDPMTAIRHE
jgi:ABC-type antimicrobial peptide transport system permease subunit